MRELEQLPIPLLAWYHENARVLPWRSDPTPYHVWVSEIMLQQTRVAAVMGYYSRFMEALPDVAALAAVEDDTLMKLWQGLGYYSRARNLKKAAGQVMERVIADARAQGRRGCVLTCKAALVHYYEKFGYISEGRSASTHGGAVWYDMRLTF